MMLHHGPAVPHCVMFEIVFFSFFLGGGGLEHGLHNMAEKCFNHRMSLGKNLFHTRVSNAL